jgi:hypothetical protein
VVYGAKAGRMAKRIGGVLAGLAAASALASFGLAPLWARTELLPWASESLGVPLTAESVTFDPLEFSLTLRGLSLKDRAGRERVRFGELAVDVDLGVSLRTLTLVAGGRLVEPSLALAVNEDGRLDLAELLDGSPEADSGSAPAFSFLITCFAIERGRLAFRDASQGRPYEAALTDLSATFENLGPASWATFEFTAQTGRHESLSARGRVSLAPLVSEGRVELADVALAPLLAYLAPGMAVDVRGGRAELRADYGLRRGASPEFELHSGEIRIQGLEGVSRGGPGVSVGLDSLALDGFAYGPLAEDRRVVEGRAERVQVRNLRIARPEAAEPGLTLAALVLDRPRYRPGDGAQTGFRADTGRAESVELAGPGLPRLRIARLSAGEMRYGPAASDPAAREASAAQVRLENLEAARPDGRRILGQAVALILERLSYERARERLTLGSATLTDLVVPAAADKAAPSRVGRVSAGDLEIALADRRVVLAGLVSERAEWDAWLDAGGGFGVSGLAFPQGAAGPLAEAQGAEAGKPWRVRIGEARLSEYAIGFRDERMEPPVRLRFTPVSLTLADFTTEPGRPFNFRLDAGLDGTGKIEVDGQGGLAPLKAEIRFGIDKLPLPPLQPYWDRHTGITVVNGRLHMWGDLSVRGGSEPGVDYSGAADIHDLATVDKQEGKDFVRWRSLKLDGVVAHSTPGRLSIRSITAQEPYARVFVAADGGLNLARDLLTAGPAGARAPAPAPLSRETPSGESWPVVIGAIRVQNGRTDFTDLSLKPSFAAQIEGLAGDIRSISSKLKAKADMLLEGRINHSSKVKIYGQINPFRFAAHTDVAMEFRGVNLTTLSPYSGKFAGYRIEKGKLDMNLRYRLHDRRLEAENRMVLDQLVLGEKVDSPTATSLPVELAVALLRDTSGRIDIDLPISGNLDDPEFSVRGLLGHALTQMVTKLVGSPFSLLGELVRSGPEDLGSIGFRPGEAVLTPDARTRLDKVAAALKERPELNLDIKGCADPARDRAALAEIALLKQLRNYRLIELRTLGETPPEPDRLVLSEAEYRRLFTSLYRVRHPEALEIQTLKGRRAALDGAEFEAARRKFLEDWAVSDLDLRLLAQSRSEVIRQYLIGETGLPDQRIYLLDVKLLEPGAKEIQAFLSVSGS